ncbi:Pescadillo-like protein, partial [Bienertia sinuspersici]
MRKDGALLQAQSLSSVDVEDEAFHAPMNGGDTPERPQVISTRIRQLKSSKKKNRKQRKKNRELSMRHDENTKTLKKVVTHFSQYWMRNRKASMLHNPSIWGEGGGCRSEEEGGGGRGGCVCVADQSCAA